MAGPVSLDVKQWGSKVILAIEHVGLLIVLGAAVFAAAQEIVAMWHSGHVGISDLLLLFIYLEVVTMSSVYWRIGRLPVRIPLYIAMVALARHLILNAEAASAWTVLAEAGAILILAVAVLLVRYGHIRLPYTDEGSPDRHGSS